MKLEYDVINKNNKNKNKKDFFYIQRLVSFLIIPIIVYPYFCNK
jgi:hypothetical protein